MTADPKRRSPTYRRGFADGYMARRAGAAPLLPETPDAEVERLWAEHDARLEHDWSSDREEDNRG